MPVSGDDFRNLVRRARYREAPSSGSMAGDPGPRIAQQGIAGRGQGCWPNWPNDSFSRRNRSLRRARWALGLTNRGVSLTTRPRILSIASQPLPFNAAYIVLAPHVFRLGRLKRERP